MKTLSILLILCAAVWFAHPGVAQTSNTMVRFQFYHGTVVVGDVDVELYDQDKPVTVSNFLHYVRSGAYHNLILQRCVPGFVLQAGGAWSPSPLSSSIFGYVPTAAAGAITNEFDVGPRLSNTFGTIAMARVGTVTNSATSEWFFNLADNSTPLDTTDGGFTVFGRVSGGTNALDYFNHPGAGRFGIVHVGAFLGPSFEDFPVSNPAHNCLFAGGFSVANCPRFNEVFHVKISVLPITDSKPPTITITSPAANATITNNPLIVTGKAMDDDGVESIFYSIGNSGFTNAPGGTNWSITTDVPAGTNYIYVSSVDKAGQRSAPVARRIFFSVREALNQTNVGNGSVVGATNGQRLEIGRYVTLTAKPAPGFLFAGWSGSYNYRPATISFPMHSNATLIATFVTNPYPQMKGTFSGLFFNPGTTHQPSGAITFNVTDLGKVSGKLNVLGRSLPFSGALSAYGEGEIRVAAAAVAPLFVVAPDWSIRFTLDTTNKTDQVFGPSTDNPGYPHVRNPDPLYGFTSELRVNRVKPGTTLAPSTFAGKYTLVMPGSTNAATEPGGDSYGAVTVAASGTAKFVGTLADGTPFTQSAPVATNGMWPFYTGLYSVHGWMYGWVTFDFSQPGDDLHGSMRWLKSGRFPGKPYPNGFELFPMLAGSRYTTATSTNRVLNFTNGIVALTGPNLTGPSTNDVRLATNNTVANLDTNKLTFTLVKPSGLFSGTVKPTGEIRTLSFKGAVLPKQNYGAGFYLSTNLSGRAYFGQ